MGEIKSTLDLVLERTKHLSLSDKEKKARQEKEFSDHLNGLLQKYQDGILTLEDVLKEARALAKDFGLEMGPVLLDLAFARLDFDKENAPFLELIRKVMGAGTGGIEEVLGQYRKARDAALDKALAAAAKTLDRQHQISGSAVLPNPEKDPEVKAALSALKASFKTALSKQKKNL